MRLTTNLLMVLAAGGVSACGHIAESQQGLRELRTGVERMASDAAPAVPITGAEARLVTSSRGAAMRLSTSGLQAGHVTTAWWVVINAPSNCNAQPCSPDDVIGRADAVETQIVYADGAIVAADGSAEFSSYLPQGDVPQGWYSQRFEAPTTAEIHLVLNDHGPLLPELAASMLRSYRGGCRDDSLPPPFPDSAKADGAPGPNSCALVQDAIFRQ
ncbi:hypothetical protein [Pelagibius sp. Alg239-R121]|uniref:hypothetical protein n=1 Tax=Pelagibius sp. Alg239-R121 TaxID=2993448 RepID=UPI0024A61587|nr:hypothetical protein [Pelagibius sp. Alg239-R121]